MIPTALPKDPELAQAFAAALAQYSAATGPGSGYVRPPDYVPRGVPRRQQAHTDPNKLDVPTAFAWVARADAYAHRTGEPVTAAGLTELWDSYRHRYAPRRGQGLPVERLLRHKLTRLQWHDVFNRVQGYAGRRETIDLDDYSGSAPEPFELIDSIAQKVSRDGLNHAWRRTKAVYYLRQRGMDVRGMDDLARDELARDVADAHRYPRTYL